jgi:hypothetical protein
VFGGCGSVLIENLKDPTSRNASSIPEMKFPTRPDLSNEQVLGKNPAIRLE